MQPILVIEDDKKIAKVIKIYLEEAGFKVVLAEQGKDALAAAFQEKPLLVVLDLMLPDISGEEMALELKEMGDFPIIMLTAKSSEEERLAGFALGADDYAIKPFSPRELVYRVKAVMKRAQKANLNAAKGLSFNEGSLALDGQTYTINRNGSPINLTATEFKVLFTLASSPAKVFTRDEIVEKALGYQFEGYERSVDAHIKNIRQKIEDDPRNPALIQTVYGVGYRFTGRRDA